jgi:hypothetical protein
MDASPQPRLYHRRHSELTIRKLRSDQPRLRWHNDGSRGYRSQL